MGKNVVIVEVDVYCEVMSLPPVYRAWLDLELFTERTWRFTDHQYLEEVWQVRAHPGRYKLRYELIGPGRLRAENWRVIHGSAGITEQGELVIHDA